ncbi:unnamed protein product [Meloidogyne enterolobii]|uniref:Uncharacterized protein n=2 Tax=Meloidogyne enterolobii TaxID=390850 RepID=A0ACB0XRT9_MELEN|nr:unnamed protein product [Meloidogyne enterolobii]
MLIQIYSRLYLLLIHPLYIFYFLLFSFNIFEELNNISTLQIYFYFIFYSSPTLIKTKLCFIVIFLYLY